MKRTVSDRKAVREAQAKLNDELRRLREENTRLRNELIKDDLTGLYNARALRERLERCIQERQERGDNPALLFVDVDYFKNVNEAHGHIAGGRILTQMGMLIAREIRLKDVAFRYGGDEFVILVCGGEAGARLVGERLRKKIESHVFRIAGLKGFAEVNITISLGLRVIRQGDTVQEILEAADKAMFEAKRNSRNTLVAA